MARTEHRDDEHRTCVLRMLVIPTLSPGQPRFTRRELRNATSHPSASLLPSSCKGFSSPERDRLYSPKIPLNAW